MKHTQETKDKISEKRKEFLKNNPDKHPWKKNEKFKSIPCEKVKQYLIQKNIVFVSEWQPLNNRLYSIDIAFPDIKLGIEINGNQHYNNDGTLKEYYQKRHDEITLAGWTLIELHYSIAWNLEKLEKIIEIKEQPNYKIYFEIKEKKELLKKNNKPLPRGVKNSLNASKKWKSHIEIVKNCNIDFSKFG